MSIVIEPMPPMSKELSDLIEFANKFPKTLKYSWHPVRDGFGEVITYWKDDEYYYVCGGITLEEARKRYGDVAEGEYIPVTGEA